MSDEPRIDFLEEQVEAEEAPAAEATETPPETVETPAAPAPEASTAPEPPDHVPKAALIAERRKRQEYEARLREYEQRQSEQMPAFNEAPQQYIHAVLQQHEQQTNQRLLNALEAQAREVYADYDEMVEVVQERAAENPVIVQQLLSAANPAMAAYKLGKQLREMEAMKDPDAYRKQIEAEVRAQIKAEADAREAARTKAAEAIPPDLTAARASKDAEVLPDDSLESILQSRKR